jgi:hypothetical protein
LEEKKKQASNTNTAGRSEEVVSIGGVQLLEQIYPHTATAVSISD